MGQLGEAEDNLRPAAHDMPDRWFQLLSWHHSKGRSEKLQFGGKSADYHYSIDYGW